MSSTKFIGILPQPTQVGDKIKISGVVSENAEQFSINFANEICEQPQSIAYHFKWDIARKIIIEDYKENGQWMDYKKRDFNEFDGPEFDLEFAFQDDGIYVYLALDDYRNNLAIFQPKYDYQYIQSIQVWGDVAKINQLAFSYN